MKIRIYPSKLKGKVLIPSSKSLGHRELICAGLARGVSIIDNLSISQDIEATCRCLQALGVEIQEIDSAFLGRKAFELRSTGVLRAVKRGVDCGESGSTLRFFIPLAAQLNAEFTFTGSGKLVTRPLAAYYAIFDERGINYQTTSGGLPLTLCGRLRGGLYRLPGDVSSQYISGLLFALPLLAEDSVIELTSPLESAAYVDLTLSCLAKYGIRIKCEGQSRYLVAGRQQYCPQVSKVEGDWSQAAFWLVGGLLGHEIACNGLNSDSLQGDKAILTITQRMGAKLVENADGVHALASSLTGTEIDGSNCPDIIPVFSVLAAVSVGRTQIVKAGRLRLKECDRLAAMTCELNKLGAHIKELPEGLEIEGVQRLHGGVECDAWNDHRVAMSLAIAAAACGEPFILRGAESVSKSYPEFWDDYAALGGRFEVIT